jgi:hypothetical protein
LAALKYACPFIQFQPRCEMLAMGKQNAAAEVRVSVELSVSMGKFFIHFEIESVSFIGAVEAHEENVAAGFGRYSGVIHRFILF